MKAPILMILISAVTVACTTTKSKLPVVDDLGRAVDTWTTNDSKKSYQVRQKGRNRREVVNPKFVSWGLYDEQGVPINTGKPSAYRNQMGGFFDE